jgi:phospholipase C
MSAFRLLIACGARLSVPTLLLCLGACGGGDGSSTDPVGTPGYTLTATALDPASITAGGSATSAITVTPANGYTGSVQLSCSAIKGASPAPSCAFSPATVTISGSAAGSAVLTVATTSSTAAGTYTLSATGSDASKLAPSNGIQTLTLTIAAAASPGYTLTATALNPASITAGGSAMSAITVTPANGYTGSVQLSCSAIKGASPAPSCAFSPASVTISGSAAGSAVLTVSTTSSTAPGSYTLSVTGSDASALAPSNGAQTLTLITLPPASPGYTLTATALNPASITAGGSATSAITVTPANGYTGSVQLSCSTIIGGTPAPSCAFIPASVTINSPTAGSAVLTVSTTSSTPGGTYTLSVTGSDASKLAPSNGTQTLTLISAAVIQHIVIIFQENRTPDNLFQDPVLISRGADIASSGINSLGQTIPLSSIDLGTAGANPQNYDLSHSHSSFVVMYDGGKLDGADLIPCDPTAECPPNAHPNAQFMYVLPSDVQPYFALAEQYTFGDRMFQTNEGPSFPAHQFILAGTSAPTTSSALFVSENPIPNHAGCTAPAATTVVLIDAAGSETSNAPIYPCFEHPTLTDLLETKGVTWRYYAPGPGSIWTAPNAIDHMCQPQSVSGTLTCTGPEWTGNVAIPEKQVLTDIANGQLAQVSWVIPDGRSSDHALLNDGSGPSWVGSIVNAIGSSPYWANTAIIISWDDWGGWYDHVPPKVIDDGVSWGSGYVYGFRVPLLVVSPYAKAAYISHTTHDFGSILKFVETTFSLPTVGYADVAADDLADCFNLTQTPIAFQVIPTALGAQYFIDDKRPFTDPDDD